MTDSVREIVEKPCVTCRFYQRGSLLSVRGALCTNVACNEKAWSFTDPVTGKTRDYRERHRTCDRARVSPCGHRGSLWESRDRREREIALRRAGWTENEIRKAEQ